MSGSIKVNGIVISSMPIGEYDKRIVLLTKELGKISAFARRSRRQSSSLLGVTNAFIYGEFELYRGQSSYSINAVKASEYFTNVTTDYDNMMMGAYFLEVAEFFAQENNDEKERLLLLYRSLQVMGVGDRSLKLIKSIYELKTMVINGEYPNLFECGECGTKEDLVALSSDLESVRCKEHAHNKDCIPINGSTLYALQYVTSSSIKKLYSFELKSDIETEFINVVDRLSGKYLNYQFKSVDFLKN